MVLEEKYLVKHNKRRIYVLIHCNSCNNKFYKRKNFYLAAEKHFCTTTCRDSYRKLKNIGTKKDYKFRSGCGVEKPLHDFGIRLASYDGRSALCSKCRTRDDRIKYHERVKPELQKLTPELKNKKYLRDKEFYLKKKYGITLNDYNSMLESQNFVCAICKRPERLSFKGKTKAMCVDHCHKTGKVRGLLCDACNNGIAKFEDDVEYLKSAILYLS